MGHRTGLHVGSLLCFRSNGPRVRDVKWFVSELKSFRELVKTESKQMHHDAGLLGCRRNLSENGV